LNHFVIYRKNIFTPHSSYCPVLTKHKFNCILLSLTTKFYQNPLNRMQLSHADRWTCRTKLLYIHCCISCLVHFVCCIDCTRLYWRSVKF